MAQKAAAWLLEHGQPVLPAGTGLVLLKPAKSLRPHVRQWRNNAAFQPVLLYWRALRLVAHVAAEHERLSAEEWARTQKNGGTTR